MLAMERDLAVSDKSEGRVRNVMGIRDVVGGRTAFRVSECTECVWDREFTVRRGTLCLCTGAQVLYGAISLMSILSGCRSRMVSIRRARSRR